MTRSWVGRGALAAGLLLAGCGNGSRDPIASGQQGGPDGSAAAASGPLWHADSRSVTVTCGSFFDKAMRFSAQRAQLSDAEMTLLAGLRLVDGSSDCWEDVIGCKVDVVQGDEQTSSYDSIQMDSVCTQPRKVVAFASLMPILTALPCRYGSGATFTGATGPIVPETRCWHGMFTPYGGTTITRDLSIAGAGEARRVELDGCGGAQQLGHVSMRVLEPAAGVVAVAAQPVPDPGADGTCARADVTFPHAGTFSLEVVVSPEFTPVGDFFMRFY